MILNKWHFEPLILKHGLLIGSPLWAGVISEYITLFQVNVDKTELFSIALIYSTVLIFFYTLQISY